MTPNKNCIGHRLQTCNLLMKSVHDSFFMLTFSFNTGGLVGFYLISKCCGSLGCANAIATMFCPWSGKLLENWQRLGHKKFITASVGLCCLSSNDQQSVDLSGLCKVTMLLITTPGWHWQCANVLQIEFIFNSNGKKPSLPLLKNLYIHALSF